ncbi:unnamed protein product [Linum trigynum]|uniref:Uncharacterized protein n=1 Tax=Linum trigynum TaxID=586398 RepID=A0AAV2G7W6_9ROSI
MHYEPPHPSFPTHQLLSPPKTLSPLSLSSPMFLLRAVVELPPNSLLGLFIAVFCVPIKLWRPSSSI